MNHKDIIKNTVLDKLFKSLHSDRLTEIWEMGQRYTLETEYRLATTETGNAIYTVTQTYKEHYDYEICGCGTAFHHSHRTRIWEQEEGRASSAYRYSESLRERDPADPEGPWKLKLLEQKECQTPDDMPQIQEPKSEQGWLKIWEAMRLGDRFKKEKLVLKHAIKNLCRQATEHTRQ
ncbi:MAG: hypothetical protein SPL08_00055 [Pseudomonadota bacterium]|nr:hypothetical protein [Pseudomonadota bacterium]